MLIFLLKPYHRKSIIEKNECFPFNKDESVARRNQFGKVLPGILLLSHRRKNYFPRKPHRQNILTCLSHLFPLVHIYQKPKIYDTKLSRFNKTTKNTPDALRCNHVHFLFRANIYFLLHCPSIHLSQFVLLGTYVTI